MKPLNFNEEFPYDIVIIDDHPYMFTNMRIDRDTIPKGYIAYDIRESDGGAGDFSSVEPFVMVNHWGTVIGRHVLTMKKNGNSEAYYCDNEDDGWFDGDCVSDLSEFKEVVDSY